MRLLRILIAYWINRVPENLIGDNTLNTAPARSKAGRKVKRAELDRFLKDWITNILDQGFKPEQAAENEVTPEQFAEAVTE